MSKTTIDPTPEIYTSPGLFAAPGGRPERLISIREAADQIGAFYWQVQRAVRRGDIPSYAPFNSRKLVKLTEVMGFIEASRQGGK